MAKVQIREVDEMAGRRPASPFDKLPSVRALRVEDTAGQKAQRPNEANSLQNGGGNEVGMGIAANEAGGRA